MLGLVLGAIIFMAFGGFILGFRRVIMTFLLLLGVFLIYSLSLELLEIKKFSEIIIKPESYKSVSYRNVEVDGVKIKIPENDNSCWIEEIPCTPNVSLRLRLLTPGNMKNGFYLKYD